MHDAVAQDTVIAGGSGGLRLGLCCQFVRQPITFRTTTAAALGRLPRRAQLAKLAGLCVHNAESLLAALQFCQGQGIGSFLIRSSILPVVVLNSPVANGFDSGLRNHTLAHGPPRLAAC